MEPIRILQVTGVMNRGGAETLIMNLYRAMDRQRFQFDFVENSSEEGSFDTEIRGMGGIIYHCPHLKITNIGDYCSWWIDFLNQHEGEYPVIHGHIGSCSAFYLSMAKKKGIFTIAHSHSTYENVNFRSLLYRTAVYPTRWIADYYMACSDAAGKARFGRRVVNGSKYTLLKNGIEIERFSFSDSKRAMARQILGISENEKVIGHIGRFELVKNHTFTVRVFHNVLKNNPHCKLLLVGDGSEYSSVRQMTEELGISTQVIFTGVRNDPDIMLHAMDVMVFPSLYEGLPVTLVEAQTSGLPCIISDRVPEESILIPSLIKVLSLAAPDQWADETIRVINQNLNRHGYAKEIRDSGYDISDVVAGLSAFYERAAAQI